MLRFLFIVSVLVLGYSDGRCQMICEGVTLGEVLNSIKTIKPASVSGHLEIKKFPSFNFTKFKPEEHKVYQGSDFYEIGFSQAGEIKTISQRFEDKSSDYDLLVYNFESYRILIIKERWGVFHGSVIVMMKNGINFLLNLLEQFNELPISATTQFYSEGSPEKISAIMTLDKNLQPIELIKLIKLQVVQHSKFEFSKDKITLEYEAAGYYFNTKDNPALQLNEETCIPDFFHKLAQTDYYLLLKPQISDNPNYPIWMFNGAHGYSNCIKRSNLKR